MGNKSYFLVVRNKKGIHVVAFILNEDNCVVVLNE
jgi:hypothetical protein